jgi:hypothetical protein
MALSSRVRGRMMDAINTTFDSVGPAPTYSGAVAPNTKQPKNDANNAAAAWEYFIAKHLLARAQKRKDLAEKNAIEAGVIIAKDPKNLRFLGQHGPIYNNGDVMITLEVKKGAERVNTENLVSYLVLKGVKMKLLEEALEKSTTVFDPSYTFTPILLGDEVTSAK